MKNILLIACLCLSSVAAAAQQDYTIVKAVVSQFVQQQVASLPGKVSYNVEEIDPRTLPPACNRIEAFLPAGSQLMGRVFIGVRCTDANRWSISIPVQIRITRDQIISTRLLTTGQIIGKEDLSRRSTENMQSAGITDESQAIGKEPRNNIAPGVELRADMLRAPYVVKAQQTVQLVIQGSSFTINGSGTALNNASEGEAVTILTPSGQKIRGTAEASGTVRIRR
jgi:flagella basal body P-ring formation protein FlgA